MLGIWGMLGFAGGGARGGSERGVTRCWAPTFTHISLGRRGVCTQMVSILDTCAHSRWDELPHRLVIMVPVSLGQMQSLVKYLCFLGVGAVSRGNRYVP